ncbi:hypothetical protein GCM10009838_59040 [Catenulispora subtropica]|uniref:Uncharacterized protein n=1 Tax=Catenulispora subtropica TaxID=450798 RepID=A0ABP5E184_9ACTN
MLDAAGVALAERETSRWAAVPPDGAAEVAEAVVTPSAAVTASAPKPADRRNRNLRRVGDGDAVFDLIDTVLFSLRPPTAVRRGGGRGTGGRHGVDSRALTARGGAKGPPVMEIRACAKVAVVQGWGVPLPA